MTRIIFNLLFLFTISNATGQNIEVSGGVNGNSFFDLHNQDGHFRTYYSGGRGYSFGTGISNLRIGSLRMRLSLKIDHYSGSFYTADGGLGGGYETEAKVEKTTAGLGLFPINFNIVKKLACSLGGELSFRISDKTEGHKSSWMMGTSPVYRDLENDRVKINKDCYFGLSGRISYDIRIKEKWFITPQYKFYIGLTDEFINTEANIKSFRQNFELGVTRQIR